MRKSCGIVSYINFAHDAPFWVTDKVLRIYHENQAGSITRGWSSPAKAAETARCYQALFERYGNLYRQKAQHNFHTKYLRFAVYLRLGKLPGAWAAYRKGISLRAWRETIGAAAMLLLGGHASSVLVSLLKKIGLIRRYG
jgi:hypothetical protein